MSQDRREVVVTDIKMPFFSMVIFILKWALASIPAMLVLVAVGVAGASLVGGLGLSLLSPSDWVGKASETTGSPRGGPATPTTEPEPTPEPTPVPCVLSIDTFDIEPRAGEYGRQSVVLNLLVRNDAGKKIKAWKLRLKLANLLGDEVLVARLTSGSANVEAGRTTVASFEWEDNQFIAGEPYDKLLSYAGKDSAENLAATILECEVALE